MKRSIGSKRKTKTKVKGQYKGTNTMLDAGSKEGSRKKREEKINLENHNGPPNDL